MRKKIFLLILLFVFSSQSIPQKLNSESIQEKKEQKALQYEVTVILKLVQVYVTDKKGNPITDLTISDFILYDNGKLQKITDFEKHVLLPKPEKKVEETKPAPISRILSKMNRKYFFLIDMARNDIPGIAKSKKAALHFIDTQLQPNDEVGILSYSASRGLFLHEYLTTDHQKIKEGIKGIKDIRGRKGWGLPMRTEGKISRDEAPKGEYDRAPDPEGNYAMTMAHQFAIEIKEFAKSLRYIPGNKNIIFFSAGFPRALLYSRNDSSFRDRYQEMSKELGSSNSPVYAVNTEGTGSMGDHSLELLSELSGGKYFDNVEYYETIAEEIQNTTSNYYVLGYYIGEQWDGKYHEINVKVKRKGSNVYAQGGYFNPKPFTKYSTFEKRLHLIDLALTEKSQFQDPINFPLITLPYSDKNKSNLVMLFEIPIEEIKEVVKGKTEIVNLIIDEQNNIVEFKRVEKDLSKYSEEKIYYYSISSLSPGTYNCRVVIRNLETGKGAVASSSVVIPESLGSGIRLYPPLLLIPGRKANYVKFSKPQKKDTGRESLSLISIFPFNSTKYSPLIEELDQGTSKLYAVLRCSIIDIQEPEVELTAHLIQHSTKQEIPLSFSILSAENQKEKTDILLIEFQMPELLAGEYSLNLMAEEMTTKSRSSITRAFRVR